MDVALEIAAGVDEDDGVDEPQGALIQSKLGCSIWLPKGWRVAEEIEEAEDPAEEARARFERWHTKWWSGLSTADQELVAWAGEVETAHLTGLLERLEPTGRAPLKMPDVLAAAVPTYHDPEASRAARALFLISYLEERRQDSLRAEPLGLLVAWFRAESTEQAGAPEIEVSRYQFKQPLDAVGFYQAAKPSRWDLVQGNRPNRTYSIDGMEAVRFYCQFKADPGRKALCYYAAANDTGWQLDCWAEARQFERLKPTLIQIAESLRRF